MAWEDRQVWPAIRLLLNDVKKHQRYWHVYASGLNQFEVRSGVEGFVVDLERKTCSCRLWQMNGYGSVHTVATICYLNRNVESYVDHMFSGAMYNKAYTTS